MKNFSSDLIARLNAQTNAGLFFEAAALTVAPGDVRHYANTQRPITIDGQGYQPMPLHFSGIGAKSDMSVLAVQVTVPNITGEVSAFVESANLLGHDVTLLLLHMDLLNVATARETLQLQVLGVTWKQWDTVTFTCGIDLMLNEQIPSTVITRSQYPGTPDLLRRASIL